VPPPAAAAAAAPPPVPAAHPAAAQWDRLPALLTATTPDCVSSPTQSEHHSVAADDAPAGVGVARLRSSRKLVLGAPDPKRLQTRSLSRRAVRLPEQPALDAKCMAAISAACDAPGGVIAVIPWLVEVNSSLLQKRLPIGTKSLTLPGHGTITAETLARFAPGVWLSNHVRCLHVGVMLCK
jgi:hypothetical protein